MPCLPLDPEALCLRIDPAALGFADTAELLGESLPWIGQARAYTAARLGLSLTQPGYNLFVLGEVGSGRSSLLRELMQALSRERPVPPDLCYLHHFDTPERPRALRLPAGQGRELRQRMVAFVRELQAEVPKRLASPLFRDRSDALQKRQAAQAAAAWDELVAFAQARHFTLRREEGRFIFTWRSESGEALSETELAALPRERRAEIDHAEQELRVQIGRFAERSAALDRELEQALAALRREVVRPWLAEALQAVRMAMKKQIKDAVKLGQWLDALEADVLEHVDLFEPLDDEDAEDGRAEALEAALAHYRVNLVVDNAGLEGAPVIEENNPLFRLLFGSIEYQSDNDVLVTDFSRIRAGSLLRAHGGFLMLHLRDLLADPLVWEKLRRFLRSARLQIEEPGTAYAPLAAVSLEPEAVDVDVKLVLIGTAEMYYELQEADPEFARHFRIKVDFAEHFRAGPETWRASAVFVAQACQRLGLPHFAADAVARLLEDAHREADDQTRQSAIFARTEALVIEAAQLARTRGAPVVRAQDVQAALHAREARHGAIFERLRETVAEGERLIATTGALVGRVNGLTQIDLGDTRFGLPVRVSARCWPGREGVIDIAREVDLSGPIHAKGVLILQSFLSALLADAAPLSLGAAVVFEQEYEGVEGDSASCAELFALLSALTGLPLAQGLAVTGALDQHGEVLPVGGLNEKIEGWFAVCEQAGLDGTQGVLIPARNRRHLMLAEPVVQAVAAGRFRVLTFEHVAEGIEALTGAAAGFGPDGVPPPATGRGAAGAIGADAAVALGGPTVHARALETLRRYRRALRRAPR
ncbi:Lon protease family protein [Tibeticola sp.]|uniref:Lon protease family protein n=1 Tax=Tibeticola sp. TaxID=2005368 RepID=UPI0025CF266E|nr:ATP-binding protein [Tibeticola sp.]